ncbi:hypothetical protein SAMN05421833_12097 [Microbispora rosea]|uniref:Uncharacterized protein n=1 Tax=Microbispora rosea TaxID=58117 RepID=A0A1N7F389_9ACTN|nr:hypothetical protein Mro03_38230 [Microbispora rosea subsp. rosea]SIR94722.1 hypothetical protein SAMN05421833_12097 [Microbispora rosea]
MTTRSVLISGASIAGPALAYWLRRHGFAPTVAPPAKTPRKLGLFAGPGVRAGPAPREGGQAVDFRGAVHMSERSERINKHSAIRSCDPEPPGEEVA